MREVCKIMHSMEKGAREKVFPVSPDTGNGGNPVKLNVVFPFLQRSSGQCTKKDCSKATSVMKKQN